MRRKEKIALWSRDDLERLYAISLNEDPDLLLVTLMRCGSIKATIPKRFLLHTVPYLQPEDIRTIYGDYRKIPKLLNDPSPTLRVISKWRLEMGR